MLNRSVPFIIQTSMTTLDPVHEPASEPGNDNAVVLELMSQLKDCQKTIQDLQV